MLTSRLAHGLATFSLVTSLAACKDQGKLSAQAAAADVAALADQVEKDVAEVQRGLPEGAKKLSAVYTGGADPHTDPKGVQRALLKAQRDVPDLTVAKSTFFALADDKGIGIRNNLEQDAMAGQDLMKLFPELSKALSGSYVETTGTFGGPAGPNGPDKDWVAASPVLGESGKPAGMFVSGWSYRAYCKHLTEVWKHDQAEALKSKGDTGKLPVFYVGIFDKTGVYTAPLTPKVNEDAMVQANLVANTAGGVYSSTTTLTDRVFGFAAKRTPRLGPDTGVVVLRSEL